MNQTVAGNWTMKYQQFKSVSPKIVVCIGLVILVACMPRHRMKDVPDAQVQSTPKPTEAMVIFLRPTMVNNRQSISLFDTTGDKPKFIGILPARKKIAFPVAPGRHRFMMVPTGTRADFVTGELTRGKSYYIRITASGGVPHLYPEPYPRDLLGTPKFSEDFDSTTWVVNTPDSRRWAERKMRNITQKAANFDKWVIKYQRTTLRPEDGK